VNNTSGSELHISIHAIAFLMQRKVLREPVEKDSVVEFIRVKWVINE
jgi:hypothetical protein